MTLTSKHQALRILLVQGAASVAAALVLAFVDATHAWSALAGGLIATLGNAFFMIRVFVPYRAQEPARLLGAFYGAELQKLVLIAALFAGVLFWLHPLSPMALFGTFLLVQLVPAAVAAFSS